MSSKILIVDDDAVFRQIGRAGERFGRLARDHADLVDGAFGGGAAEMLSGDIPPNQTVYLRNMMEYNIFQQELAVITNQAILDLGGRLDAYQRMFDDDVDPDLVNRRIESAEIMNAQTGNRYEEQAKMRNTELLMMLILMESQVR